MTTKAADRHLQQLRRLGGAGGVSRVTAVMDHASTTGQSKLLKRCTLATATGPAAANPY